MNAVFNSGSTILHKRAPDVQLCSLHTVNELSPYSPLLNLVEEIFSKFEHVNVSKVHLLCLIT